MEIKAALLSIGSEILTGSIVDTNAAFLAKRLTELGVKVGLIRPVPDDLGLMVNVIQDCMDSYELVLTTGGLGPTFDDMTAEAVAKAIGVPVEFNEEAYRHMVSTLTKRGVSLKASHRRQAELPKNCILFPNNFGTAMGFACSHKNGFIISMPGIPYEMKPMFENYVLPFIMSRFQLPQIFIDDLRFVGLPESDVNDVIVELGIPQGVECIINVSSGEIIVRVRSSSRELFEGFVGSIVNRLQKYYVGRSGETLEKVLVRMLAEKGMTISFAESCTGGLMSKVLTDVPGSSNVFLGSVVSYSNEAKIDILNVDKQLIEKFGAVSAEVAEEMARGCKRVFNSDIVAAVTGIAGPGGGTNTKPVGLVYTAVMIGDELSIKENHFSGDRDAVRERSYKSVFNYIIKRLREI